MEVRFDPFQPFEEVIAEESKYTSIDIDTGNVWIYDLSNTHYFKINTDKLLKYRELARHYNRRYKPHLSYAQNNILFYWYLYNRELKALPPRSRQYLRY